MNETKAQRRPSAQWAGQFIVAGELERHGYVVSFTMGNNTPVADLMVGHPSGEQFWVDVKAQWAMAGFFAKPKAVRKNLFYILSIVARERGADKFFVLTQAEFNGLIDEYMATHPNGALGFNWSALKPYQDQWEKLPGW